MSLSTRRSRRHTGVYRALKPQLESINRTMANIHADGNCLFRAIAEGIGRSQAEYPSIKEQAIEYIKNNASDFESFLESTLEEYCNQLRGGRSYEGSMWGGHIELVALSRSFQINIRIFRDGRSREFHYSDDSSLVELAYNGSHYNLVILIDEDCQEDFSEHPLLANLDFEMTGPEGDCQVKPNERMEAVVESSEMETAEPMDVDDPFSRALSQPDEFSLGLPAPPPPMFNFNGLGNELKEDGEKFDDKENVEVNEQEKMDVDSDGEPNGDKVPLHLADLDGDENSLLEKPDPAPCITNQLLACCHNIVFPAGTMKVAMKNCDQVLGKIDSIVDSWFEHEKKSNLTENQADVIGKSLDTFKQENRKFVKKFFSPYENHSQDQSTSAELREVEEKCENDIMAVKNRMQECLGILRNRKQEMNGNIEETIGVISGGEEIDGLFEQFRKITANGLVESERRGFDIVSELNANDELAKNRMKQIERHAKALGELDARVSRLTKRREAMKENASAILDFVRSCDGDAKAPFLNWKRNRSMSSVSEYTNHTGSVLIRPSGVGESNIVDGMNVLANDKFDAI